MSMATTRGPVFDRVIDQPRARSRPGSANSVPLNGSLSPPPRRRKPQSPATFLTSSATSLPVQRPPMSAPVVQIMEGSDASPFCDLSLPESLGRPNSSFALYDEGDQHAHKYANSFSSLNLYSNLLYNPEDEARSSPIIRPLDNPTMDRINFDDAASTEDYSDLLYPELQSPVESSQSVRDSNDVHGPPMRKQLVSFASRASHDGPEGPESPVEFANISALSLPSPLPVLEEHLPSKVDRLLGIDSQSSSKHGSTDMLLIDQARRGSFVEFDIQSSRASPSPNAESALRSQSSISDEMPVFALRHKWSVMASQPSNSIGGYRALVEAVDHVGVNDASPKLESRQILVDGSDKRQRPKPSNPGNNLSSASHAPLSTTNLLDKKERADAVRKNRKILQVLGPGVVPSAQTFARTGSTTPSPDTPGLHHDPSNRPTRSHSLGGEEVRSEVLYKTRAKGLLIPRRPPDLQVKSSWTALEQDTIFLSASGRRHSSPMNLTFGSPSISGRFDSDTASLSSLGSIIVGTERIGDKEDTESRSAASFMEMSDEEGAKTPKRRPSVESGEPGVQSRQRTGRAASLNDILTISGALEAPQRVGTPDTPVTDYSLSIASRNRSRPTSDMTFQSSLYSGRNIRDDYDLGDINGDEAGLERQRKREKLAKVHRYLGSKVPPELVLGHSSSSSPPSAFPSAVSLGLIPDSRSQEVKTRRRSSGPVMYQHTHNADLPRRLEAENRAQDTFTDVERMMRIRRAQKLEQIFGEWPSRPLSMSVPPRPSSAQGLSSNQYIAPTTPSKRNTVAMPTPEHPQTERGFKPPSPFVWKDSQRPSTSGSSRPSTGQSTTGLMSSHQKVVERDKKSRGKHHQAHSARTVISSHFPVGTALGSPEDLYGNEVLDISAKAMAGYGSKSPVILGVPTSRQFLDYRNSLNSLSRILDHDDRQSLNDLHAVLDSDEEDDPDQQTSALPSGSIDTQRTLQPRVSLVSINSVATTSTYATLTPNPMGFQARRKRAAKLTHFFGASYRDLFGEVLVRIERGMLEEAGAGQISEEEVKHLMKQLDLLKSRQFQLS